VREFEDPSLGMFRAAAQAGFLRAFLTANIQRRIAMLRRDESGASTKSNFSGCGCPRNAVCHKPFALAMAFPLPHPMGGQVVTNS
jgi:hypothetical protein